MVNVKKYVVYTAVCGGCDSLHDPETVFNNTDYIAFVDKPIESSIWKCFSVLPFSIDKTYFNRRNAKIYKVLPHLFMQGWDMSIWHDPTHEVVVDPKEIYNNYLHDSDIALFEHESRNCVYDEAKAILNWKMESPINIKNQIEFYERCQYPYNNGLYECPVIIRKNNIKTQTLGLRWWETICKYSSRDQLSMPFVLWSLNIKPRVLPGTAGKEYKRNNKIVPFKRNHNYEPNIPHLNLD